MRTLIICIAFLLFGSSVNIAYAGDWEKTELGEYMYLVDDSYLTGWHEIDGIWYYFDSDGTMLHDAFTPDGWLIGSDGAWEHVEDYTAHKIMEQVYSNLNPKMEDPVTISVDVDMNIVELDHLVIYLSYKYKYGVFHNHCKIQYLIVGDRVKEINFTIDNPKQLINEIEACDQTTDLICDAAEGMTDQEKMAFFNLHLVNNCTYCRGNEYRKDYFGASGALLNGQAVCNGYSQAFYFLCQKAGIYCEYVFGEVGTNQTYHVWNRVKIDGITKYIDVTWNDSTSDKFLYYLLDPEAMPTHNPTGYRGITSVVKY